MQAAVVRGKEEAEAVEAVERVEVETAMEAVERAMAAKQAAVVVALAKVD